MSEFDHVEIVKQKTESPDFISDHYNIYVFISTRQAYLIKVVNLWLDSLANSVYDRIRENKSLGK